MERAKSALRNSRCAAPNKVAPAELAEFRFRRCDTPRRARREIETLAETPRHTRDSEDVSINCTEKSATSPRAMNLHDRELAVAKDLLD
jgi:hypothetical protein